MRTEEFFEFLLEFGEEWKVKEVESVAESDEVDIYVESLSVHLNIFLQP